MLPPHKSYKNKRSYFKLPKENLTNSFGRRSLSNASAEIGNEVPDASDELKVFGATTGEFVTEVA